MVPSEQNGSLAAMSAQLAIIEVIKHKQLNDEYRMKIYEAKPKPGFTIEDSVLKFQRRLCVPNDIELMKRFLEETHKSMFAMLWGNTKMYQDLKLVYW